MKYLFLFYIVLIVMWLVVGAAVIIVFINTQRIAVMWFFIIPLLATDLPKTTGRNIEEDHKICKTNDLQ